LTAELPPHGWATVRPAPDEAASRTADGSGQGTVSVSDRHLENARLRVEWGDDGQLSSIFDRIRQREVIAEGRRANVFQLHPDRPENFDAWDIDHEALDHVDELTGPAAIEVVDEGPVVAAVRFSWRFGRSSLTQVVSLAAGSPVLELATTVDWHEDHRLLKAAFPVDVRAARATFEVQYGHVERSTHENTSWDHAQYEVCAHRWADLSEHGFGVALLNDCKYGYDVKGDVLRLSLLRASTMPDPVADRGEHRFTYALLPHGGSFAEAGVVQRAAELGITPEARFTEAAAVPDISQGRTAATSGDSRSTLVSSSSPGVVVSAVKPADVGDGLVVRLYEAWGGRRRTRLKVAVPVAQAQRADVLEQPQPDGDVPFVVEPAGATVLDLELRPFEIVTLLLTPGTPPPDRALEQSF
jgi:alpha-mannosidase